MRHTESNVRALAERVRMDFYPFEYMAAQNPYAGYCVTTVSAGMLENSTIQMSPTLSETGFMLTYLHEACHLIANRYGLDRFGESAIAHTHYFAALVAVCYQRIGKLNRLSLYDFGDRPGYLNGKQETDEGRPPTAAEWADRLRFVLETCERYADSDMSIEAIAAELADRRRQATSARETAARRKARRSNWIAGTVGVALSLAVTVGGRSLGLI